MNEPDLIITIRLQFDEANNPCSSAAFLNEGRNVKIMITTRRRLHGNPRQFCDYT